jgi:rod shape-determining protein MreC
MRRSTIAVLAVGGIVAIFLLSVSGILHGIESSAQWLLMPIVRVFSAGGSVVGSKLAPAPAASDLQQQNADLETKLTQVTVDYVHLKSLEDENASLRQLTKFLDTTGYDEVSARIIARNSDAHTAEVMIDRGSRDGLELGMAVVAGSGVLYGKITQLSEHVATVTLVSDERSRVAATVAGQHETLTGLVLGEGNGVARLTLIPQAVAIKQNDVIVTAGTEEKVPANLAIGLVNDVEGAATDPFKSATIQPLARFGSVNLVAVLRPEVLRPNP